MSSHSGDGSDGSDSLGHALGSAMSRSSSVAPMEETMPNAVEAPGEEAKGIAPEVVMAEAAASGGGPTGASPVPPGDSGDSSLMSNVP